MLLILFSNVWYSCKLPFYYFLFFSFIYISWRLITLHYCSGFCHILVWISHGFTCVPHPETPSHFPPDTIPLGHPSAPAWTRASCITPGLVICFIYDHIHVSMLFLSDHPTLALSHKSLKVCSIHLCFFCCLAYRVIITIFLNSKYMC